MPTTELSTCTLAYPHPLKQCITIHKQDIYVALLTPQPSTYKKTHVCHVQQQQNFTTCNLHSNVPYRLSTARASHSFCIQDRPHLPCSLAIKLQPHTIQLLHALQHALHTRAALPTPTAFHNPPMHTTRHRRSWENGTWYRYGVKLRWCHSHLCSLVWFHPYMCLFSFRKRFYDFKVLWVFCLTESCDLYFALFCRVTKWLLCCLTQCLVRP